MAVRFWRLNKRRREITVALLGIPALFVICSLGLGYLHARAPISWGIGEEIGTGRHFRIDSRLAFSARFAFVSVTPAGAAAGLQPGDILDTGSWTLHERLAFAYPSILKSPRILDQRGRQSVVLRESPSNLTPEIDYSRISDITVRLLILCSGLLIIQYGHGRAALAAGIYLATAAMADSPIMTFAGLPIWVQASAPVIASLARLVDYAARFAFAMELLHRRSRELTAAMWLIFAAFLGLLLVFNLGLLASLLVGTPPVPYSPRCQPIAQMLVQSYSLLVFAAAAILAPREHRFVIRIIFFGTLITIASYIFQELLLLIGSAPPAWLFWYFNSALLGAGIGYPWAIFARRIAGVDVIVSRGVAYATSIGLLVIAINLLATVIEQVASGWVAGLLLAYGVPVVLGLCLNWVQNQVTRLLETVLDHDLLKTSQMSKRLKAEFLGAHNSTELADQVAAIAAPLRAHCATMYAACAEGFRAIGDATVIAANDPGPQRMIAEMVPIDLRGIGSSLHGGLLLPMIVFGRVVGALHCGPRAYDRGYDYAEHAVLEDLAHELAIAFVYLDSGLNVRERLLREEREAEGGFVISNG